MGSYSETARNDSLTSCTWQETQSGTSNGRSDPNQGTGNAIWICFQNTPPTMNHECNLKQEALVIIPWSSCLLRWSRYPKGPSASCVKRTAALTLMVSRHLFDSVSAKKQGLKVSIGRCDNLRGISFIAGKDRNINVKILKLWFIIFPFHSDYLWNMK